MFLYQSACSPIYLTGVYIFVSSATAGATTPTPVVTALPVSAVEVQGGVNSAARAIQGMGNKFGLDSVDDMVDHSLAENIVEDFGFSIEDFSVAVVVNSPSDRSATNTATSNTTTIYAALHAAQQRGAANRVPGTAGANTNEITVVGAMRIDANATASAIVSDTNQLGVAGPVSQLHRSKSGSRIVSSSNGNLSEVASPSPLRNSKSAIHLSESKSQGTSDSAVKLKQEDSKGTINISAQT
ncbi:hypothetical protein SARC_14215 [Sphaeroforma arctica JP610]|uniref:Uncharacterized protein n=1 Tax=Sphaeroforma arctica JP610 TaxID=667725 RepID=A0A0L0F928_9EUKA|nr:hypothetical protein SARC_14215 [Sphaeroforma arctica JP610]KNC73225.1 hypothetical protein SARC_14215 [Sphaeroforma arctica JP610]|eukprot:XP_014147127.1 hypothetical protein SARC_14215 [Sphaeroforma arctica JP610]